jgi:hypothetical protein
MGGNGIIEPGYRIVVVAADDLLASHLRLALASRGDGCVLWRPDPAAALACLAPLTGNPEGAFCLLILSATDLAGAAGPDLDQLRDMRRG